jgi:hypothetical protein
VETNETLHSEAIRQLENYYDQLKGYSWMSAPSEEKYDITKDCDLECSEECLDLRHNDLTLDVLDSCNVNRCNCYYSEVSSNLCTPECKKSCILVPGGRKDIEDCLSMSCECDASVVSLAKWWPFKKNNKTKTEEAKKEQPTSEPIADNKNQDVKKEDTPVVVVVVEDTTTK